MVNTPPLTDDSFSLAHPTPLEAESVHLDMLCHLAPYSALLLIVGQPGDGKELLIEQFVERANAQWQFAFVQAHALLPAEQILRHIGEGLGLEVPDLDSPAQRIERLSADLRTIFASGIRPIVVIDDAQDLEQEALQVLQALLERDGGKANWTLLLVGTPLLVDRLDAPGLETLKGQVAHLFEVGEDTAASTLRERGATLQSNGWTARAVAWWRNRATAPTASSQPKVARVGGLHLALGVVGILLVGALIFQDRLNALFTPTPPATETAMATPALAPSFPPAAVPAPQEIARDTTISGVDFPVDDLQPAPLEGPAEPMSTLPVAPLPPPRNTPEPTRAAAVPQTAADAGLHGEDWLLRQKAQAWTVQYVALQSTAEAREYARAHGLREGAIFRVKRNGRTLQALVAGVYPNRDAAQAAAQKISTQTKPWVRRMETVHAAIHDAE